MLSSWAPLQVAIPLRQINKDDKILEMTCYGHTLDTFCPSKLPFMTSTPPKGKCKSYFMIYHLSESLSMNHWLHYCTALNDFSQSMNNKSLNDDFERITFNFRWCLFWYKSWKCLKWWHHVSVSLWNITKHHLIWSYQMEYWYIW